MQPFPKQSLTNVQLELLKVFSHQLPDSELLELRHLLVKFFAEKLVKRADEVWDEQGWTNEEMDKILTLSKKNLS